MPTSVYLVDDHPGFRACLRQLLGRDGRLTVAGEAGDAAAALQAARRSAPSAPADVLLLDVTLPGMDGVALARALHAICPSVRLVSLSMHDDPALDAALRQAGVRAVLAKDAPLSAIVQTLLDAAAPEAQAPRAGQR